MNEKEIYLNSDEKCECWKCELGQICPYAGRFQRLPRERGGLGLCKKLTTERK